MLHLRTPGATVTAQRKRAMGRSARLWLNVQALTAGDVRPRGDQDHARLAAARHEVLPGRPAQPQCVMVAAGQGRDSASHCLSSWSLPALQKSNQHPQPAHSAATPLRSTGLRPSLGQALFQDPEYVKACLASTVPTSQRSVHTCARCRKGHQAGAAVRAGSRLQLGGQRRGGPREHVADQFERGRQRLRRLERHVRCYQHQDLARARLGSPCVHAQARPAAPVMQGRLLPAAHSLPCQQSPASPGACPPCRPVSQLRTCTRRGAA